MPQLNPSPWFMIILFTWLMFLLLAPSKILAHNYPLQPLFKNTKKSASLPWDWMWQ